MSGSLPPLNAPDSVANIGILIIIGHVKVEDIRQSKICFERGNFLGLKAKYILNIARVDNIVILRKVPSHLAPLWNNSSQLQTHVVISM